MQYQFSINSVNNLIFHLQLFIIQFIIYNIPTVKVIYTIFTCIKYYIIIALLYFEITHILFNF